MYFVDRIKIMLSKAGENGIDYVYFDRSGWAVSFTVELTLFDRTELAKLLNELVMLNDAEYSVHKYDTTHINVSVR